MELFSNSRKVSPIDLIDNKKQFEMTEQSNKTYPVSKSLKSFFMKLRGNNLDQEIIVQEIAIKKPKRSKSRRYNNHNRHTMDFSNLLNKTDDIGVIIRPLKQEIDVTSKLRRASSLSYNNKLLEENENLKKTTSFSSITSSISSYCINSLNSPNFIMKKEKKVDKKKKYKLSLILDNQNEDLALLNDQQELECHQIQLKLWQEDIEFCPKEEIAEYLGSNLPNRSRILYLYLSNFDFSNQKLDLAFRKLCTKLYFKAESQQLDRIIQAFAKRYFDCNPNTIFQSVDIIHAIAYSLLLLNTDLHVVLDSHKMTKSSFIKNTMETIQSIITPVPKSATSSSSSTRKRCVSLTSHQSLLDDPIYQQDDFSPISSSISTSSHGSNHQNSMIQKLSNISWKPMHDKSQKNWLLDVENILKDMYTAVKINRIDQADTTNSMPTSPISINRSKTLPKKNIMNEEKRINMDELFSMKELNTALPTLIKKEEMYKQGLVMRKHVMESNDKRAKNRQWQLCYLLMTEGELVMYKPTQEARRNTSIQGVVQQSKQEKSQILGTLKLNHAVATPIPPPGWNPQRPHVFKLETSEGGLWLFEATDYFAIQAWVEACNLTASKISKSPLPGAICNIDYGWGVQQNNFNDVPIWYPPSPCMIDSQLDLQEQYQDIQSQIQKLNEQLEEHNASRINVDKKLTYGYEGYVNSTQAVTNWDKKLHHILHELEKLNCYQEAIKTLL